MVSDILFTEQCVPCVFFMLCTHVPLDSSICFSGFMSYSAILVVRTLFTVAQTVFFSRLLPKEMAVEGATAAASAAIPRLTFSSGI